MVHCLVGWSGSVSCRLEWFIVLQAGVVQCLVGGSDSGSCRLQWFKVSFMAFVIIHNLN